MNWLQSIGNFIKNNPIAQIVVAAATAVVAAVNTAIKENTGKGIVEHVQSWFSGGGGSSGGDNGGSSDGGGNSAAASGQNAPAGSVETLAQQPQEYEGDTNPSDSTSAEAIPRPSETLDAFMLDEETIASGKLPPFVEERAWDFISFVTGERYDEETRGRAMDTLKQMWENAQRENSSSTDISITDTSALDAANQAATERILERVDELSQTTYVGSGLYEEMGEQLVEELISAETPQEQWEIYQRRLNDLSEGADFFGNTYTNELAYVNEMVTNGSAIQASETIPVVVVNATTGERTVQRETLAPLTEPSQFETEVNIVLNAVDAEVDGIVAAIPENARQTQVGMLGAALSGLSGFHHIITHPGQSIRNVFSRAGTGVSAAGNIIRVQSGRALDATVEGTQAFIANPVETTQQGIANINRSATNTSNIVGSWIGRHNQTFRDAWRDSLDKTGSDNYWVDNPQLTWFGNWVGNQGAEYHEDLETTHGLLDAGYEAYEGISALPGVRALLFAASFFEPVDILLGGIDAANAARKGDFVGVAVTLGLIAWGTSQMDNVADDVVDTTTMQLTPSSVTSIPPVREGPLTLNESMAADIPNFLPILPSGQGTNLNNFANQIEESVGHLFRKYENEVAVVWDASRFGELLSAFHGGPTSVTVPPNFDNIITGVRESIENKFTFHNHPVGRGTVVNPFSVSDLLYDIRHNTIGGAIATEIDGRRYINILLRNGDQWIPSNAGLPKFIENILPKNIMDGYREFYIEKVIWPELEVLKAIQTGQGTLPSIWQNKLNNLLTTHTGITADEAAGAELANEWLSEFASKMGWQYHIFDVDSSSVP